MNSTSCPRVLLAFCLLCASALGQQAVAPTSLHGDLNSARTEDQNQSLGDLARKMRKDPTSEVQMSAEDAKKLFQSVDKIVAFAAVDTGFAKHSFVKRRLVGPEEVETFTRGQLAKQEYAQRFARSEMTMKKFGLLPRDFNLREFLVKANGKEIAGYYDEDTKSISLLNWIPLERQAPILAHELTHALQDQNYDLKTWQAAGPKTLDPTKKAGQGEAEDDSISARHAVVEGQAVVVMVDYILAPLGRSVQNTPGLIYQMEDPAVKATYDSELLHGAPMILREAGTFPYRAGLIFEGELLQKGGKQMAFAGAFARPPRNTHEVLQPKAYIDGEKLPAVRVPDVRSLLSGTYEMYDSGSVGELDVRGLLKQYGDRIVADDLASAWRGGAFVTFRRTPQGAARVDDPTTADLALLYVSRWQSTQSAERFAHLYATAVGQRYQKAVTQPTESCAGTECPVSAVQVLTEEGPVIVERWADNTVLVSESFDATTAAKLSNAVRQGGPAMQAENLQPGELSLRLCALPEFSAFQQAIATRILDEVEKQLNQR
jgi:phosphopantetheinyl transferase (holo-ACP synthase)